MNDNNIQSELLTSETTPFIRARSALIEWTAHTLVVAGLLVGFRLIEILLHFLWSHSDRLLFGKLPLHWIFDAADLAILGGFLTYGVVSVLRAYCRNSKSD